MGGPVRMHRNSADQALIVCQALVQNNHALRRDFIFANLLGVIAAAHLDHHHNLAKLTINGYIPQPDDVIAEERNGVCTEGEFSKRFIYLNCAQNRYADSCQCEDHPVERFAKVRAEAGRKSHLKPAKESITRRFAPIFWTASRIDCMVSSTDKSRGRR